MSNRAAFVVAFLIRSIYGGAQIVAKLAFNEGMSTSVFVFYRHATALLFLVPIAFVLERKTAPPLSFKVSLKLFAHAFYGISGAINISCLGLKYASATASSAILNLLPVVAFFLALLLGVEFLNLKRFYGIAKVSGVLFCIAGVIVLAFYQGPQLKSLNHHRLFHHISTTHHGVAAHPTTSWVLGIFLTTLSTSCWALWTVLQGPMLEAYPSKLLNTTLQIIFATIQSFFIALAVERDFSRWKLGPDACLVAVLYTHAGYSCFWSWLLHASMGDRQERASLPGHDNANNSACHNSTLLISPRRISFPGKCNRWNDNGWRPVLCSLREEK
ncbi:WAT1-related protein At5g64700 isoform X2 [Brachypodium distachyon]|uniref:WAT1-related protein At5g64700 isoform X2 n=1 Tax=Brachypodium distachyon TaxID=15368 RepID=UPI0001D4347A|nr:WAT1-related protein At5g64700 isoform X2 [Brachypodium distachyon]|eukprot:XP_014753486.1 WAT1-related protein At5g64700 isoform X2 [Brachypodium distachyon]